MKLTLILSTLCMLSSLSFGVSAFPGELTFTQSDGESFQGRLKGDEWLNYVSLPNDYVAVYNKEAKNYEYALIKTEDGKNILIPSGQKVSESLHLNKPKELAKTIPPLNTSALSQLYRKSRKDIFAEKKVTKDHNKSQYKHKVLKTKSTQWKEVLKEENPPK